MYLILLSQLVRADTDDKTPIAVKHKHKRHFWVFRMSKHAWLEIKPDVVETLDALISQYSALFYEFA
jgi:hypothetical protein